MDELRKARLLANQQVSFDLLRPLEELPVVFLDELFQFAGSLPAKPIWVYFVLAEKVQHVLAPLVRGGLLEELLWVQHDGVVRLAVRRECRRLPLRTLDLQLFELPGKIFFHVEYQQQQVPLLIRVVFCLSLCLLVAALGVSFQLRTRHILHLYLFYLFEDCSHAIDAFKLLLERLEANKVAGTHIDRRGSLLGIRILHHVRLILLHFLLLLLQLL